MKLGIEFFAPGTSLHVRRRRWIFFGIWMLAGSMVVWPLFAWFGARPVLVFGLPSSIAWVILALALQFAGLLWLFFGEEDDFGEEDEVAVSRPGGA